MVKKELPSLIRFTLLTLLLLAARYVSTNADASMEGKITEEHATVAATPDLNMHKTSVSF